jgi:hypothetical protein
MITESDANRFWSKVDRSGGPDACWNWQGSVTAYYNDFPGYGQFYLPNTRKHYAHRIAYEITHGVIPSGMLICHHCDNSLCCNPAHLFMGTDKDNTRDMYSKGRAKNPGRTPKVSEDQVIEIVARYTDGGVTQTTLANEYGVDQSLISHIMHGRLRRSITKDLLR